MKHISFTMFVSSNNCGFSRDWYISNMDYLDHFLIFIFLSRLVSPWEYICKNIHSYFPSKKVWDKGNKNFFIKELIFFLVRGIYKISFSFLLFFIFSIYCAYFYSVQHIFIQHIHLLLMNYIYYMFSICLSGSTYA